MSKPKPRRKLPGSSFKPAESVPSDKLASPGEPGYLFNGEKYVGIRIACRACGDPRRVGLVGLYTLPGNDGEPWYDDEPWFEGDVIPGPVGTSITLPCRDGHQIRIRYDWVLPLLERMRNDVGPHARRVVTKAL